MRVSTLLIVFAFGSLVQAEEITGLNLYCDPIGTTYEVGTPLMDRTTGQVISRGRYLEARGLNMYCDPIGTMYPGGTPLFNFTGEPNLPLEEYLARKTARR